MMETLLMADRDSFLTAIIITKAELTAIANNIDMFTD
jgi:hypothetical protein